MRSADAHPKEDAMQFLRTLFWVVLAVIAAVFSLRNWVPVPVNLWGGLVAFVKLPVLVFGAFLVGLIPPLILHRATRWRLRRKLGEAERSLVELRPAPTDPTPVVPAESASPTPPPPASF
jgi:lipopolysaccharide assembly protein A